MFNVLCHGVDKLLHLTVFRPKLKKFIVKKPMKQHVFHLQNECVFQLFLQAFFFFSEKANTDTLSPT